ncbi:MAG: hypothetical protein KME45_17405 [Stenomitos rutilans HA7619-LM2]|nr:hypothetical protein [Stenomitos rutilans HA7619-LM2]
MTWRAPWLSAYSSLQRNEYISKSKSPIFPSFTSGFWLLASGFWLLASGFWLLAPGFWL